MWSIETTDEFDTWFGALGEDERDEIDTKVALLKEMGPFLKRPHADTLDESRFANMKELRGKTKGSLPRIAFAFDPFKTGILLCGGDKKGVSQDKFYKQLIEKADRLYERHLQAAAKRTAEMERRKAKGNKHG
jgi:hypothetical protein